MTSNDSPARLLRDILRWWPLILVPVIIAVAAAIWSTGRQAPSYTATTRLQVVPLAQWDETFLGTSLVRDAGDAKQTATTTATLLKSPSAAGVAADYLGNGWTPESVDSAISVAAVPDTNLIEITGHSTNPGRAERVAEGFAKANLADRWRKISAELDARLTTLTSTSAGPDSGDTPPHLQTLTMIRQGSSDPTLKLESSTPAMLDAHMSKTKVLGLAVIGGSGIGVLAAALMVRLQRRPVREEHLLPPDVSPAYSPDAKS